MSKRKKIAIFGWKTGDNSFGVTVPYYEYFDDFGDINILSPVAEIDFSQYDLLVIPGGPDISPNSYGRVPSMFTGKSDPIREYFDKYMVAEAIKARIPIIGICRGHQVVATHFGASLDQHMYHKTSLSNQRGQRVHELDVFPDVLPKDLAEAIREKLKARKGKGGSSFVTQSINSLHHQVVEDVPEGAVLLGTHYHEKEYKNDKSIEALYYPEHDIITFQYHPEEIWDNLSRICVAYLLKRAGKNNEKVENTDTEPAIRV